MSLRQVKIDRSPALKDRVLLKTPACKRRVKMHPKPANCSNSHHSHHTRNAFTMHHDAGETQSGNPDPAL